MDWRVCEDIRVIDDDGHTIYYGPKWLRCERGFCGHIVTYGTLREEGCCPNCGWRRAIPVSKLLPQDIAVLQDPETKLAEWEAEMLRGETPWNVVNGS